jgi:hypothetical protein
MGFFICPLTPYILTSSTINFETTTCTFEKFKSLCTILYINSLCLSMTWHSGAERYPIPSSKFQPSPEPSSIQLESSSIQPDGQFLNNCPSVKKNERFVVFCWRWCGIREGAREQEVSEISFQQQENTF